MFLRPRRADLSPGSTAAATMSLLCVARSFDARFFLSIERGIRISSRAKRLRGKPTEGVCMVRKFLCLCIVLSFGALASLAVAQENPKPVTSPQVSAAPAPPSANPADVTSPDAILAALYDVISGPAEKPRDWNRFRSLFLPGARLVPTGTDPKGGERARSI